MLYVAPARQSRGPLARMLRQVLEKMMSTTARPNRSRTASLLILGATLLGAAYGAEPPVSPQILGTTEATLEFCATADAPRSEQYRAQAGLFLNGATEDQLTELRKKPDYKTAYDAATAALQQMGKEESLGTCKKLLQRTP
jgi:hypothetical protein